MARMRRKFADVRAAANEAAAIRRENYMATQGRNIKRRNIVDSNQGQGFVANLAKKNRNLSQLPVLKELNQLRDDFGGALKSGIGKFIDRMPSLMALKGFTRHGEEVDAASRDYKIPWWKGGNPIAVDRGSYVDQFLEPLMDDKRAYNQAVRDDKVFWSGLEEMSGDNYEASHPGYLALLNDPSRLNKLQEDSPIRALNYMRSIMGDPSNIGFDQLEAMRAGNFEGLNLPTGAEEVDYGGLTATQIAQKLLPQYRQAANEMYGEGFLGNTAAANYGDALVPPVINQATGVAPVDIEYLRDEGKGGHLRPKDLEPIPAFAYPETDISGGAQTMFEYPYGQLGDPDVSAEGEEFLTPTPFSAASMYPNLNLAYIRNKIFPGMNLEDITQEDLSNLSGQQRYYLGG